MTTVLIACALLASGVAFQRQLSDLRALSGTLQGTLPGTFPGTGLPLPTPALSVVVPARDEEASLPALLDSLRSQDAAPLEVVVVDDGSRDATAEIARAAGAHVLTVTDPPSGWTGKAWACHLGAGAAAGDVLLFLDADTVLSPHALRSLLSEHERHGGLLSVQPYHEVRDPYEHASAYFNVVSLAASGAFGARPDSRPMAFGPCLLTSRADYERAGGHTAVRADILDDVALARAYARADLPVCCFVGGAALRMRMYPGGPAQLAEGWTKNIASGAAAASPGPTGAAVAWVAAHHAVTVGATAGVLELLAGRDTALTLGDPVIWLLAYVATAVQLRWALRRVGSFHWQTWAVFPLPLAAFDLLFVRSVVRTLVHRSVSWRGRDVRLDARRSVGEEA